MTGSGTRGDAKCQLRYLYNPLRIPIHLLQGSANFPPIVPFNTQLPRYPSTRKDKPVHPQADWRNKIGRGFLPPLLVHLTRVDV